MRYAHPWTFLPSAFEDSGDEPLPISESSDNESSSLSLSNSSEDELFSLSKPFIFLFRGVLPFIFLVIYIFRLDIVMTLAI